MMRLSELDREALNTLEAEAFGDSPHHRNGDVRGFFYAPVERKPLQRDGQVGGAWVPWVSILAVGIAIGFVTSALWHHAELVMLRDHRALDQQQEVRRQELRKRQSERIRAAIAAGEWRDGAIILANLGEEISELNLDNDQARDLFVHRMNELFSAAQDEVRVKAAK